LNGGSKFRQVKWLLNELDCSRRSAFRAQLRRSAGRYHKRAGIGVVSVELLKKLQLADWGRIDIEHEQFWAQRRREPLCFGEIVRYPDVMERRELPQGRADRDCESAVFFDQKDAA
jgi:hypothetical protein